MSATINKMKLILDGPIFRTAIIILIVINALILGALTYREIPDDIRETLIFADQIIVYIFVAEIITKLFAYRLDFFKSGWNIFDFLVVGISLIPGGHGITVLRALRVLRVLRLLRFVPMMRRVTEALFRALPGMGAIISIIILVIYVYAVMATTMFGQSDNPEVIALFGNLQSSALTMFQIMTLDGWRSEVVQLVIDDGHPWAGWFFIVYIFLVSFAILNLFIALIVDALQADHEAAQEERLDKLGTSVGEANEEREEMMAVLMSLRSEISFLRERIDERAPSTEETAPVKD